MSDTTIKCASAEYHAQPFYLIQRNGKDIRYVVSFQDKQKIKSFLLYFTTHSSGDHFQLKIRDHSNPGEPTEVDGTVSTGQLSEAFELYEEVIFHDGFHEFMIRKPENGEYVAFDEHGLLFIYTDKDYSFLLDKMGLSLNANEKFIYQFNHWHYRPANGREDLNRLIKYLGLN